MRVLRVFPRRTSLTPTDELAFVGSPPLDRPEADEVHVSCAFTWDKPKAEYLAQAWAQYYPVRLGGPAYDDVADGFVPGQYVRAGVTFTSRGCNNQCPWCLVWRREGKLSKLLIQPGHIVQDNNLLQCSQLHLDRVWQMLGTQHAIEFSGGLEARLVTDRIADAIRTLRVKQLFFACDTAAALHPLELAIKRLQMPRDKVRCYVLLAFNGQTISKAQEILEKVWIVGSMPFAQLYQPPDKWIQYSQDWRDLARTWSRPAAMKAAMRGDEVRDITSAPISESQLEDWLLELCQVTGWSSAHFRPGMLRSGKWATQVSGNGAGFPDWILAKPDRELVIVELKSAKGVSSLEQIAWGELLKQVKGVRYLVIRPVNRDELERILTE